VRRLRHTARAQYIGVEQVIGERALSTHTPFRQEAWTGYEPIELPPAGEDRPRYQTEVDGRTYRLYWADLHNHSGLTCDAHGEPDELLHYARDRARLDAVALTDNDEVFDDPLTEAEYALSVSFARHFTREGEFLALPGYEWTSHLPNRKDVEPSDPRCWDFRWFSRNCRPNHRTAIYPLASGPLVRHTEVGNRIERLHEAVAKAGGVVFPHQGRWDSSDHPTEVGVEVASRQPRAEAKARMPHQRPTGVSEATRERHSRTRRISSSSIVI